MRRLLLVVSLGLSGLLGCGDEYHVGLGHTYAQMQERSRGFEYRRKTPARWILGPGRVHLDLGGAWFVLDDAYTSGTANHPDPNLDDLAATDWSDAYAIEVHADTSELVGLDDAKSPRRLLELMEAIRAVGWVPKGALPSSAEEVSASVAAPPHRATWDFVCPMSRDVVRPTPCPAPPPLNPDGSEPKRPLAQPHIRLVLMWEPEDSGKARYLRRGVHLSVNLRSAEDFDVRLIPPNPL